MIKVSLQYKTELITNVMTNHTYYNKNLKYNNYNNNILIIIDN